MAYQTKLFVFDYILKKLGKVSKDFFLFYNFFLLSRKAKFQIVIALKLKIIENSGLWHLKA